MDEKEILEKTIELVEAYKKMGITEHHDEIIVLRLFIQVIFPGLTIRSFIKN